MGRFAAGWDLGGPTEGRQMDCRHVGIAPSRIPCTLWRGLEHLERALAALDHDLLPCELHRVTLTGELVDLFADRRRRVGRLIEFRAGASPAGNCTSWGRGRLSAPAEAKAPPLRVASAN